jgi:uncharacterized membrane protein YqjE
MPIWCINKFRPMKRCFVKVKSFNLIIKLFLDQNKQNMCYFILVHKCSTTHIFLMTDISWCSPTSYFIVIWACYQDMRLNQYTHTFHVCLIHEIPAIIGIWACYVHLNNNTCILYVSLQVQSWYFRTTINDNY